MTNESLKPNPNLLKMGMIVGINPHEADGDFTYPGARNPCYSITGKINRTWGSGTVGEAKCTNRGCSYTKIVGVQDKKNKK